MGYRVRPGRLRELSARSMDVCLLLCPSINKLRVVKLGSSTAFEGIFKGGTFCNEDVSVLGFAKCSS